MHAQMQMQMEFFRTEILPTLQQKTIFFIWWYFWLNQVFLMILCRNYDKFNCHTLTLCLNVALWVKLCF